MSVDRGDNAKVDRARKPTSLSLSVTKVIVVGLGGVQAALRESGYDNIEKPPS